ncbi:endonuclease/exonuclease/phosphatase family protein [Saccharopolyspora shandongensis]|uniref:endonuclease/exonuclease/phosphatase family protein n=1 Tax=Saccharopolyspora shandongensis TaxID=418495 RepID=UPI0033D5A9F8
MLRGLRRTIAAAGLAVGVLLTGLAAPAAQAAPPKIWPGRVMTWNMNAGGPYGPERDAQEIAKYGPEVIGLQEACMSDVRRIVKLLDERGLRYHVAYGSVRNDRWNCTFGGSAFGNAILSASPITYNPVTNNIRYLQPTRESGLEARGYMMVTTKVNGKDTKVFNTHLSERKYTEIHLWQVGQLRAHAGQHSRAIVLGDFNALPNTPEIRMMWHYFKDADPLCHPDRKPVDPDADGSPVGCKTTLTGYDGVTRRKFDYIFLRGFAQPGVGVHDTPASDHHLVHADLKR